jgi:hypothetical protein
MVVPIRGVIGVLGIFVLVLLVAGCADLDLGPGLEPKLSSEAECSAATNYAKCRMAHDLAGGSPIGPRAGGR